MHLPNLSGLSLRDEAPTDVLLRIGTLPPSRTPMPVTVEQMLQCIQDKVRPLVYSDQTVNELFDGDYTLAGKDGFYLHNEIVPYGGKYIPGVLQASYDYEVLSETKFMVRVHATLQNSICGEPIQTRTFEFEYEDDLYQELTKMMEFFSFMSTQPRRRRGDARLIKSLVQFAKNPRAKHFNESTQQYGMYLTINCFTRFDRPFLYLLNSFKEGEGLPFTKEWYHEAVGKMMSDDREEAKMFDNYIESIHPKGERLTQNLEYRILDILNKRAEWTQKTKGYPFRFFKFGGKKEDGNPMKFAKEGVFPRTFWLLFVLQAIEKTLVNSIYSMLHAPPPEKRMGGPAYEMWMNESRKMEEGGASGMSP